MTTINAPLTHGQLKGDLGFDFVYAEQEILEELQDRLSVMSLLPLVGDVAGTGSDTLRITNMGNVGFSVRMDALATETSRITPKTITTGYSTVTTGQYGLAHSESYRAQNLGREPGVRLESLKAQVPNSFMATLRYLTCVEGSTFAGTAVGSTSQQLAVDDILDYATILRETLGSGVRGNPVAMLSPQQVTQLLNSAKAHPAYQNSIADFTSVQGLDFRQQIDNFLGLGFNVLMTDDVQQSGGAYRGFGFSPGGIGWAVASSSNIVTANPAMYIPQFGMLIEDLTEGGATAERIYNARAEFGVAKGDGTMHVQTPILSVV